jgi:hypothetical protein
MDAYVLTEQYMAQLILAGGELRQDVPANLRSVYLDARYAKFVIELNQARASALKEATNALLPYLK